MTPEQLLREGKLVSAIEALSSQLRDNPTDRQRRTFLFELLCFAGEYHRAEKQLDLLAEGSAEAASGTLVYRAALHAEELRQELLSGGDRPKTEPLFSPGVAGTIRVNGSEVKSIGDSDPRIGDRLEVFAGGDYLWIPFEHVASISMEPPKRLRDLLWTPANLRTGPGFKGTDLGEVLVPALTASSHSHPEDLVRLGRVSEWCADENGEELPYGRKMLLVDGEEVPILEIRELEIAGQASAS
jgi:type VI secretion system protein ImpE